MMKNIFEGIQFLFEEVLFLPYKELAALELENWSAANIFNWLFTLIASVAFVYWMKQLQKFNENKEENRSVVSHSFLAEDLQKD